MQLGKINLPGELWSFTFFPTALCTGQHSDAIPFFQVHQGFPSLDCHEQRMSPTIWKAHNSDIFPVNLNCSSQLNRFIIVNENNWKYTEHLVLWLESVCNCVRDASQCSRTDYLPVRLWWSSAVCKCSWCSGLSGRIINEVQLSSHPLLRFSCYVLNLYHPFFSNIDFDLEGTQKKYSAAAQCFYMQLQKVVFCSLHPEWAAGHPWKSHYSGYLETGTGNTWDHLCAESSPSFTIGVWGFFPVKQRPDHRDELGKCVPFNSTVSAIERALYIYSLF